MATLRERVAERYPDLLPLLKQPEVGRLLTLAVQKNWSPGVFQSKFRATRWFRTQSESQRRWWVTASMDPGEARQQINAYKVALAQAAAAYGVQVPNSILGSMARGGLSKGFDPTGPEMMYRLSILARRGGYATTGARRTAARAMQQTARRDYFYTMNSKNAAHWGDQIARGLKTEDDVRQIVAGRAAQLYPQFATGLKQGQTMYDLTDGARGIIAEQLELDPDTIDFTQGRWSEVLSYRDTKTKQRRPMTASEVQRLARSDKRFWATAQGRQQDAALTQSLLQKFGERA